MILRTVLLGYLFCVASCQTLGPNGQPVEEAPVITDDTAEEEMLEAAIKFGGTTLEAARTQIKNRRIQQKTAVYALAKMTGHLTELSDYQLANTMALYLLSSAQPDTKLFLLLVQNERDSARVLGWNLAAQLPNAEMAKAIDFELTRVVKHDLEELVMIPQMADAVRVNGLKSAYTVLRSGLMARGDAAFALAMLKLEPEKSVADFMSYLAKASIEDLRQINQTTVNIYTCMVILKHMANYPDAVLHPQSDQLFYYAVSRNAALSELGQSILEISIPFYRERMALILNTLPVWIQLAYIEVVHREKYTHGARLLSSLKEVTPHGEVSEEINTIH